MYLLYVSVLLSESLRASTSVASPPSPDTTDSPHEGGGKASTLVLSDEEKKLLSEEGITLPTDMPLTKVCRSKMTYY